MVDRGSQGNPALATAAGGRPPARPAVCQAIGFTAGAEPPGACAHHASRSNQDSRSGAARQAESRSLPDPRSNREAINSLNHRERSDFIGTTCEVFPVTSLSPVVKIFPAVNAGTRSLEPLFWIDWNGTLTKLSGSSSAVERQLPKLDVTGSIPVSRSNPGFLN